MNELINSLLSGQTKIYSELRYLSAIRVSGAEAATFLQGQLSCDIDSLEESKAQLGACVNLKGRLINSLLCVELDGEYFLLCHRSLSANTVALLKKYGMFSKVEITEEEQLVAFGTSALEEKTLGDDPLGEITQFSTLACQYPKLASNKTALSQSLTMNIFLFDKSNTGIAKEKFEITHQPVDENSWRGIETLLGYPMIESLTSEVFTPQAVNFELTNGISFTKGCYTGQEVVARLHYRGESKKRAFIGNLKSDKNIPKLDLEQMIVDKSGKTIGQVINLTYIADNEILTLISIPKDFDNTEGVYFTDIPNMAIEISPPPYPLEID